MRMIDWINDERKKTISKYWYGQIEMLEAQIEHFMYAVPLSPTEYTAYTKRFGPEECEVIDLKTRKKLVVV